MLYELYLITNTINNKKYVGQTTSLKGYKKRFNEHCECALNGSPNCLHKAMVKYGIDNFIVKRLLKNIDEDNIDFYEILWIDKLETYYGTHKGYNMTRGGKGTSGYIFTNEVRAKMSDSCKRYWKSLSSQEYAWLCQIRRDNMKGKPKSEEHKKKLSELAKLKVGEKNPFYGKHHSNDSKNKISESNSKLVGMYNSSGEFIRSFNSLKEANKYLLDMDITKNSAADSRISKICNGSGESAYGFIWKFL